MKFNLILLSLVLNCGLLKAQSPVKMKKEGGVYMIPCKVNGLKLKFVFDTGASDVSISSTEALFMLKNDYLSADDFTGTQQYRVANGELQEGYTFIIKELEIGGIAIQNVTANIVKNLDAPLLLGQSALSKFGRITFDYDTETLYLGSGSNNTATKTNTTTSNDGSYTEYGISPSFKMVAIPAGTFTMGCTSEQGSDCEIDESPTHSVSISAFKMMETEVTVGMFRVFINATGYKTDADRIGTSWIYTDKWEERSGITWRNNSLGGGAEDSHPVINVSYNDAIAFCDWLNSKCKKHYRLPTEAEWEYAARGGQNYKYAGSNNIEDVAWCDGNSGSKTHSVKGKRANNYDLYDMTGNVWEWCSDWYSSNYYSDSSYSNPQGASSGTRRVLRGGCWLNSPRRCRVASRRILTPERRYSDLGFRLVISE